MKKICLIALLDVIMALSLLIYGDESTPSYHPLNGFVPDAKTAMKIAEAVWLPIYGQKVIESEKPFKASFKDGIWIITGTLPSGYLGGVALAEIAKSDGRIIRVTHGQ